MSHNTHADHAGHRAARTNRDGQQTVVLEVTGQHWASSKNVAEATLGRLPGVLTVDANPVGQTATIAYDPALTNVTELRIWVQDCGYHCAGQSVPHHLCDPMTEPEPHTAEHNGHPHTPATGASDGATTVRSPTHARRRRCSSSAPACPSARSTPRRYTPMCCRLCCTC